LLDEVGEVIDAVTGEVGDAAFVQA